MVGEETTMAEGCKPWWQGRRGEWYVAGQVLLGLLVFCGPGTWPGLPYWPPRLAVVARATGAILMATGAGLLAVGGWYLGRRLTPLPLPKANGDLVQTGPYRLVRHPMYAGGLLLGYGWALWTCGWLTLAYATGLLVFLDRKSAREERWLAERFPEYPNYQRRVRKLIPWIY
jgi:protein-S-isoprenylcysteine O-methyltransferase Ste14